MHGRKRNDGSAATTSKLSASKGDGHVITGAYVLDFINLGNDAMDAYDLATAEKYFRAAAAEGNADAHFDLGNLLTQLEGAADQLSRAWTMGVVDAALNLGLVLQTLHRNDEAEAAFRNGWEAGDEGAGHELAWCLHERGDTHAARQVFRKMSREESYLGRQAAGVLGTWAEMNGKRNRKTLKRLERGLWAYQDAAPALAAILVERGDFEEARALLEEHIAYSPRASVRLGNLLMDHFDDRRGAEAAFLIGVAAGDAHAKDNLEQLRASPSGAD
jgi:tetratricopeptide (TPR) repeat protein